MLAGASVRYELITCCWFIVSLAEREYSELDYCWRHSELILLCFYWWYAKRQISSSGISIGQVNPLSEARVVHAGERNERRNLNIETYVIKLSMSMAFLPKMTSVCCNLKLLWKRPLISLLRGIQENNSDSVKSSKSVKDLKWLYGFFSPHLNSNNTDWSLVYTT